MTDFGTVNPPETGSRLVVCGDALRPKTDASIKPTAAASKPPNFCLPNPDGG